MFELFVMSLREYWSESEEGSRDVQSSIDELQAVLTEHYEKKITWDEPEVDPSKKDEEISVDVIDDVQVASLHCVAAKLELDGKIDGLEFDPESPWDCDVFDRLEDHLDKEDKEVEKFPHILSLCNSYECLCIPVDLPSIAEINVSNDEDEEEEHHHHCDCDDDECCCCEDDENSIDVSSIYAIRRELDVMADALKLDKSLNIDTDDVEKMLDEDDPYYTAKLGWYILSAKIDDAIAANLPLVIRFTEDEYDDLDEDGDVE